MIDKIDIQKIRELNADIIQHARNRLKELNKSKHTPEFEHSHPVQVDTVIRVKDSNRTLIDMVFPVRAYQHTYPDTITISLEHLKQDEWRDYVIKHIDDFYDRHMKLRKAHEQAVNDREYKEYQRLKAKFDKND